MLTAEMHMTLSDDNLPKVPQPQSETTVYQRSGGQHQESRIRASKVGKDAHQHGTLREACDAHPAKLSPESQAQNAGHDYSKLLKIDSEASAASVDAKALRCYLQAFEAWP